MECILGLDIGGSSLKICLTQNLTEYNVNNLIHKQSNFETLIIYSNKISYETNFSLNKFLFLLNEEFKILSNKYEIKKIGIAFPGVLNFQGIVLSSPNAPFFLNKNIKSLISETLNFEEKLICIDNDANIAGFCEYQFLKHKDELTIENKNNFIFITLGSGIGGSFYIDGNLYKGQNGGAGEIGHSLFNFNIDNLFIENYIKEIDSDFISSTNEKDFTIEATLGANNYIRLLKSKGISDYDFFTELIEDLSTEKNNSLDIIKLYSYFLGISLSSIINILDINHIILGGGISSVYSKILPTLNKTLKNRLLPHIKNKYFISLSKFGNMSGALGACLYTLNDKKLVRNKKSN